MNQILATENNPEKKKTSNSKPADVKNIVRFFAIALIVFAVLLIASGTYSLIRNKNSQAQNQNASIPNITITQQGAKAIVTITHDKPIDKIRYAWGDGVEETLQGMGRTKVTEPLDIPLGTTTLNLRVTDNIGKEARKQQQFSIQEGQDLLAPTIELADDGEGNIKIVAKDDVAISYILYSWNDGEQTKVEVHPDSPKQIQEKIKSLEGFNTLKVVAVDQRENKAEKEQQVYAGAPKISVIQEGEKLRIRATDDVEIEKISYVLNGRGYESGALSQKEVEFEQELDVGQNIITITVTNKFKKQSTFEGKCTR